MDTDKDLSFSFTYDSFSCYAVNRNDCEVTAVTEYHANNKDHNFIIFSIIGCRQIEAEAVTNHVSEFAKHRLFINTLQHYEK